MAMNKETFPISQSVDLQHRILKIYDHLYANARIKTPAGISKEVGKILHAAMYVEETTDRRPAFKFTRTDLKGLNGGENFLAIYQAQAVRKQFVEMNNVWQLYDAQSEIELDDRDISYVCGQLNGIVVSDSKRDVFGDALEIFRSQWAKKTGGQFFTDQRVTSLAMTLLEFDPRRGDDLIDICGGTGGFLLAGINHIRRLLDKDPNIDSVEIELVKLASQALRGQEVDNEVCNIANATLSSRLSTVRKPFVVVGDSLKPGAFDGTNFNGLRFGDHRCAASNPPFGTKITIKDHRILTQFDLAKLSLNLNSKSNGESNHVYNRAPDILFLEQNIKMLRPGEGRLAIVLPYQILSGPQMYYVRYWLLRQVQIQAVIDLPNETFQPHTGTKTCLLVIRRLKNPLSEPVQEKANDIFMSIPRWIGHDRRGNPIYQRTVEGKQGSEILTDFPQIEQAFEAFRRGGDCAKIHESSFVVSSQSVIKDSMLRLNALFYKPPSYRKNSIHLSKKRKNKDWERVKIEDVVKRIFYPSRFKRNYVDYSPGAVPFLGGSNITELIVATEKWLAPDDPKIEELVVRTGWILVTRSGSTGIISTVPSAWDGVAMSEHIIRIIPDPDKLDPAYLQVFLRTKHCQEQLAKGVFGSVIDEITPEFIGGIELLVPRNKRILDLIVDDVRKAEEGRQLTLEKLFGAVEILNESIKQ